jgi:PhnB protein
MTMAIKQVNPYLNFSGNAAEAIAFYEGALDVVADNVMRFGDVPGQDFSPESKGRIMHARLHLGGGLVMISDTPVNIPTKVGTNVHVTLDFDDVNEMKTRFAALGKGGQVTMPLQDTFWGATFGMLTDAYGVQWMFNCEKKKA